MPDRAANRPSKVVIAQWWNRNVFSVVKVCVGIQNIVSEKFIHVPMKLVCSGIGDDIDLSAGTAAKLRVVVTALDGELSNRIHTGIRKKREIGAPVHIVRTVNVPCVLGGPASVDGKVDLIGSADRIARSNIQLVRGQTRRNSRHQGYKLLIISCR